MRWRGSPAPQIGCNSSVRSGHGAKARRPPAQKIFRLTPRTIGAIIISLFDEITKYMREFMAVTSALSDPSRVRMLLALRRRELCVCQITELFGLAPSTISKHLSILHHAGLIQSRKTERWVYYRLPDKRATVAVREALDWVRKSVAKTDEAAADAKKLKRILKTDLAVICRRQMC
jgi:ArsR family transcriptional regulator